MFKQVCVPQVVQRTRMTRVQREFGFELDASFGNFEIFPYQMAQAVMQIGYGWPQCDGGAVLLNCLSIVSFCRLEVAHQLMQAIRVRVCLVESKISRGCQFV